MVGIASLPMYAIGEIEQAQKEFWQGLAGHFRHAGFDEVPDRLTPLTSVQELWNDPRMFFSQCCGYDLVYRFHGLLEPLARPVIAVEGHEPGLYFSKIIVREDSPIVDITDLFGSVAAVNGPESHSGMNALRHLVAPLARDGRFFNKVCWSGGHAASLALVKSGDADVAAVDSLLYALLKRYRPLALESLRILTQTRSAPTLPYVTRAPIQSERKTRLRDALLEAFQDPQLASPLEAMLLNGALPAKLRDYKVIEDMEQEAAGLGYKEIS